jgi:hypothetical protein
MQFTNSLKTLTLCSAIALLSGGVVYAETPAGPTDTAIKDDTAADAEAKAAEAVAAEEAKKAEQMQEQGMKQEAAEVSGSND